MKTNNPQLFVNPYIFAKTGKTMEGELPLSKLVRLLDIVKEDEQEHNVNYFISFHYDSEDRCYLKGHAKINVQLECYRCLKWFPYEIEATFEAYIAKDEFKNNLSKQLDVVLEKNSLISIADIIEDELILHLPQVSRHCIDDPNCIGSDNLEGNK